MIFENIYTGLLHCVSVYFSLRFIKHMVTLKYHIVLSYFIMLIWDLAESFVNVNTGLYKVFPQQIFFFLNNIMLLFLLFRGSTGKKILTVIFMDSIGTITQFFFIPLGSYLSRYAHTRQEISFIFNMGSLLALVSAIFLYIFIGNNFRNIRGNMPAGCILYLLFLSFFISQSVIYICNWQVENNRYSLIKMLFSTFYAWAGMLLIILSIYYIEKRISLLLMEQHNCLLESHIKSLKSAEEITAGFRHDVKNHMICLKGLLQSGHAEEANSYLDSVFQLFLKSECYISTGNAYADAILQEKLTTAESNQIQLEIDMLFPPENNPEPPELCIILSNALDNAIEACMKITDATIPKYIRGVSYIKHSYLIIIIENTIQEPVEIKDGFIKTTKKNKQYHGIGLSNIKAAVGRCHGNVEFSSENGRFQFCAILPLALPESNEPIIS